MSFLTYKIPDVQRLGRLLGLCMVFAWGNYSYGVSEAYKALTDEEREFVLGTCLTETAAPVNGLFVPDASLCWKPGTRLTVSFLDGDERLRNLVMKTAAEWSVPANICFVRGTTYSDIRITLRGRGFSSVMGTKVNEVPAHEPTMRLGFAGGETLEMKRRRILHEFGHVLGFGHEQLSPNAKIPWDPMKVMKSYTAMGWTASQVLRNVLSPPRPRRGAASEFDRHSIMLYPYPASLTLDGSSQGWNLELSALDKSRAAKQYPREKDSCDEDT